MNRSLAFDSPFLLGFEPLRDLIDRAGKSSAEGYPPYNVEDRGEGAVRITLSVAGFAAAQLSISLQDQHLTVIGTREVGAAEAADRVYLHRGIAARSFQRGFVLADGMQVDRAALADGLLHIDAHRPKSAGAVRNIPISNGHDLAGA